MKTLLFCMSLMLLDIIGPLGCSSESPDPSKTEESEKRTTDVVKVCPED